MTFIFLIPYWSTHIGKYIQQKTSQNPQHVLHKYIPSQDSNIVKLYKKKEKVKSEKITNHFEEYFEKKYPPDKEPNIRPKYNNEPIMPNWAFEILLFSFIDSIVAIVAIVAIATIY